MALNEHLKSLNLKKGKLDLKILTEEKRPLPDSDLLHVLKLRRLKIQDEIEQIKNKF